MSEILRVILVMSVSGSSLALLLFALKPLIKNRLPKSAQYYLWLVVIAALFVPVSRLVVLPEGKTAIPSISSTIDRYVVNAEEVMERVRPFEVETADGFISVPESSMKEVDALIPKPWVTELVDWCAILYSLGVMFVLAFYICAYGAFVMKLKQTNIITDIDCPLPVYRNIKAATPMLIGLFHPVVVLPDCEYTDAQLHAVLLHELTHLRRKDVLVKWLSLLACAVHWFNPIVWLSRREIDRACELATDEAVIRGLDAEGKRNYGDTLIHVAAEAKTPHAVLSTTMCEEKKTLKERLEAIMKSKKHTRVAIIVSVVLILAVGCVAVAFGAGRAKQIGLPNAESILAVVMNQYNEHTPIGEVEITDRSEINQILNTLSGAQKTRRQSVNEYPNDDNFLVIRLYLENGMRTLCLYTNRVDYIEEPYIGVYRASQKFDYLYFVYAGYPIQINETYSGNLNLDVLSKLRTPYVGNGSAVGRITNLLPIPDSRLVQKYISIGDDYGSGYSPYTLTLYYEPRERGAIMKSTDFPPDGCDKNAILLFALIDNLQEVSFAFRTTATEDGELDKSAYEVQVNYTKDNFTDGGLEWSGLWNGDALNKEFFQETKPNKTPSQLEKAPQLEASIILDGSPEQRVRALQLTTSWSYVDENGNGSGYEADSPHAMQLKPDDLEKVALREYSVSGEVEITWLSVLRRG